MHTKERGTAYLFFSAFIAILGGFLFGYFTGVISGALPFLTSFFQLTILQQGWAVSIILVAALIGAIVSGMLADKIGRKKVLALTAFLFIVGASLSTASHTFDVFLAGRFISGLGVGLVSVVVPMYLAEISPPNYRGMLVGCFQLSIGVGILTSYIVNYFFMDAADWKWMIAIGMLPSALQIVCMYFVPESPAWLLKKGKEKEGLEVLERLRKDQAWKVEAAAMKSSEHKTASWKTVFSSRFRFVILVGLFLGIAQQFTGVNIVFYYAPKLFETVGFGTAKGAVLATIILGIVNVSVTYAATLLLDKLGRRTLLLIGVIGMAVCFGLLTWGYFVHFSNIGTLSFYALLGYVAFFALGLGPVTWVVLSEIYPLMIRGKAMTLAIFGNWLCNYFVSLTFLPFIEHLKPEGTFLLYTMINIAAIWFIARFIPETKGKSLEDIEKLLIKRTQ